MTPKEFFYPIVVMDFYQSMTTRDVQSPTAIHFTIDECQGILEVRHIAEALHILYELVDPTEFREWSPVPQRDMVHILSRGTSADSVLLWNELPPGMLFIDVLLRSNLFPLQHLVQRRGAILDALFRISEGFYFGPHHLIMATILHFEAKVHRKKLQRADTIPLLFVRLLYHILYHMGYPTKTHLERCHHCREQFTLDKWTQLAGYSTHIAASLVPQAEQAQQDELPTESVPPAPATPTIVPVSKSISTTPPSTSAIPPVAPSTSKPLYHHFFHGFLCHDTYIPGSYHHAQCFIPTGGGDACIVEPAYCYPS